MGSWFSNLHVKKSCAATEEALKAQLCKIMSGRRFVLPTAEDYDGNITAFGWTTPISPARR